MILTSTLYFKRGGISAIPIQSVAEGEVEAVEVWPPNMLELGAGILSLLPS